MKNIIFAKKYMILSFSLSLFIHLLLFSLIFFSLKFAANPVRIGDNKNIIISSYIIKNLSKQKQEVKIEHSNHNKTSNKIQVMRLQQSTQALQLITKEQSQEKNEQFAKAADKGVQTEPLLALLHDVIQRQQRYPMSAQAMGRQGTVQVGFTLFVNGTITDLHVVKSSGTSSLDDAALDAVRSAAPFQGINKYLSDTKNFNINIVFNLATF